MKKGSQDQSETIQFNITAQSGQSEITFRTGDALPAAHPSAIHITGRLSVPADFLQGKLLNYDPTKAHLRIHRDANSILLELNDKDPHSSDSAEGRLDESKELAAWGINSSMRWKVGDFIKFIRQNKFRFADPADQAKLLSSLQKWSVTVEKIIKEHNDNTGNSLLMLETKVRDVEILQKFVVDLPIFKGYPAKRFTVELGLDPKHTAVDIYLISDELFELTYKYRDELINEEIKRFQNLGFSCSFVWIS